MDEDSTFAFLEQFEKAERNVSKWPEWMQRSASIATASFRNVECHLQIVLPRTTASKSKKAVNTGAKLNKV